MNSHSRILPTLPRLRPLCAATARFTLIEMLVVISIISILAALLLPTLQKAQDTARVAGCTNNLKQINMAVTFYQNDYSGFFPLCLSYDGTKGIAYSLVSSNYAGDAKNGVWRCPGSYALSCYDDSWATEYLSYAPNSFVFPGYSGSPATLRSISAKTGDVDWRRISNIRKPSKTNAIMDRYITWRGYPQIRGWNQVYENHHWSAFDECNFHNGRTGVLYVDGHSALLYAEIMTTAERQDRDYWGIVTW